jgi:hypothetical protein
LFYKIEKIVDDKVYWASLWNDPDWWSLSKKLTNLKLSGGTPFWNSFEWDMSQ